MSGSAEGGSAISNRFGFKQTAFTLIELLVVIATLAILAVMLLPALAGTQAQSRSAACTVHLRQWAASANLYAADNQGWLPCKLPANDPSGGGAYAWDVGTQLPLIMQPFQLTVPMWFDPFRPTGYTAYLSWVQANSPGTGPLSDPMNLTNVIRYFVRTFPNELSWQAGYCYWVPRWNGSGPVPAGAALFPIDYSTKALKPAWASSSSSTSLTYGWPRRIHDVAVPYVPFMSDTCGSGNGGGLATPPGGVGTDPTNNLSPNLGHFQNNVFNPINLGFADGHVASHNLSQIQACYAQGGNFWFY
jgi:prepilin-type N-terminal cleavage/methylation domain-containing protein/prepilin-type processing-associated H-X9-DG protein